MRHKNNHSREYLPAINYRLPVWRLLQGRAGQTLPPGALQQAIGMTRASLQDEATVVRGRQFIRLLRTVTELLADEYCGLSQRRAKPGTFAMLVEIALDSGTLGVAMERAARFLSLLSDDVMVSFALEGEDMAFILVHHSPEHDPGEFLVDYLLLSLHRTFSWVVGCLIPVKRVELVMVEKPNPGRIALLLRGDWQSGASRNAIIISRKYFDLPVVRTQTEWREHVEQARRGVLNWPEDESSHTARVRALLRQSVDAGAPLVQLDEVAARLHLTAQTLRRHLREEGMNYQQLLDDFRRSLAIDMLYGRHLGVAEVAASLGFAEPRSFSRAFKGWTGYSPSAYTPAG